MKIAASAGQVGVDSITECPVTQEGDSVLGRENDMEVDLRKGLGHDGRSGLYNPFGVGGLVPSLVPQGALRDPGAVESNPFGVKSPGACSRPSNLPRG